MPYRPSAIVIDIEGTTTPVSFVADVLFPYARERLADFVRAHRDDPEVRGALAEVRDITGEPSLTEEQVIATLTKWLDEDRKVTPLKTIQGLIWRAGYSSTQLSSPVYEDVPLCLNAWRDRGIRLFVYSSGSVEAQRQLFSHSTAGDLTPLLGGYFDTRVGPKVEARSYAEIAREIDTLPEAILFLTDNPAELAAARLAGWQTVRIDRSGAPNQSLVQHDDGLVAPTFAAVEHWLNH